MTSFDYLNIKIPLILATGVNISVQFNSCSTGWDEPEKVYNPRPDYNHESQETIIMLLVTYICQSTEKCHTILATYIRSYYQYSHQGTTKSGHGLGSTSVRLTLLCNYDEQALP